MDSRPSRLVPATPELARRLAERMKREHAREAREVSGLGPAEAVLLSLAASVEAYACVVPPDGDPVFMLGVGEKSPITGGATVWMLGSEETGGHPRSVVRSVRQGLARAFAVTGAGSLEQFVPAWYRTGLRFLLRFGFEAAALVRGGTGGGDLVAVSLARERFLEKGKRWDH